MPHRMRVVRDRLDLLCHKTLRRHLIESHRAMRRKTKHTKHIIKISLSTAWAPREVAQAELFLAQNDFLIGLVLDVHCTLPL